VSNIKKLKVKGVKKMKRLKIGDRIIHDDLRTATIPNKGDTLTFKGEKYKVTEIDYIFDFDNMDMPDNSIDIYVRKPTRNL
jgi:hypothetical protein